MAGSMAADTKKSSSSSYELWAEVLVAAVAARWEEGASAVVEVLRRASAKRSASSAEKSRRWEAMGLEVRASSC